MHVQAGAGVVADSDPRGGVRGNAAEGAGAVPRGGGSGALRGGAALMARSRARSATFPARRARTGPSSPPRQEYVGNVGDDGRAWLYRKPYDAKPHNHEFFDDIYPVLGLIRAMRVRPGGRVLDVGCGPGWTVEILAGLGYDVDGLEPAADMIAHRRAAAGRLLPQPPDRTAPGRALPPRQPGRAGPGGRRVRRHPVPRLAAPRHRRGGGLARCHRLLKPCGVLGISEGAWISGAPRGRSAARRGDAAATARWRTRSPTRVPRPPAGAARLQERRALPRRLRPRAGAPGRRPGADLRHGAGGVLTTR